MLVNLTSRCTQPVKLCHDLRQAATATGHAAKSAGDSALQALSGWQKAQPGSPGQELPGVLSRPAAAPALQSPDHGCRGNAKSPRRGSWLTGDCHCMHCCGIKGLAGVVRPWLSALQAGQGVLGRSKLMLYHYCKLPHVIGHHSTISQRKHTLNCLPGQNLALSGGSASVS